jgi:hypothetical protein
LRYRVQHLLRLERLAQHTDDTELSQIVMLVEVCVIRG